MKKSSLRSQSQTPAFTLIELLVVISIIGVLAGLLLPALAGVKKRAMVATAKQEMNGLAAAIQQYEATYNRFPATNAIAANTNDVTFGYPFTVAPMAFTPSANSGTWVVSSNTDVITILMDVNYGVNSNHVKNPQQQRFFDAKMTDQPDLPGVSTADYQFRDPWKNPYIITLDMNFDDNARDAVYARKVVTEKTNNDPKGFNGLVNKDTLATYPDHFELNRSVMVWSLGPDGKADPAKTGGLPSAKTNFNGDNILSWQ